MQPHLSWEMPRLSGECYKHMMYQAQIDLTIAHYGLGKVARCEEESLKIKTYILPKNHRDLVISYSRLGDICC